MGSVSVVFVFLATPCAPRSRNIRSWTKVEIVTPKNRNQPEFPGWGLLGLSGQMRRPLPVI
jgi:hypothetical protein